MMKVNITRRDRKRFIANRVDQSDEKSRWELNYLALAKISIQLLFFRLVVYLSVVPLRRTGGPLIFPGVCRDEGTFTAP